MNHHFTESQPEELESLRHLVEAGDKDALNLLIEKSGRLAIRIGISFANNKQKKQERISDALYGLTMAANQIANGAIKGNENHTASRFIQSWVRHTVRRTMQRDRLMRVAPETFKKIVDRGDTFKGVVTNQVTASDGESFLRELELLELIAKSIKNQIEDRIISMRIAGYKDVEIATEMGLSAARVGQIRQQVGLRIKACQN